MYTYTVPIYIFNINSTLPLIGITEHHVKSVRKVDDITSYRYISNLLFSIIIHIEYIFPSVSANRNDVGRTTRGSVQQRAKCSRPASDVYNNNIHCHIHTVRTGNAN